MSERLKPPSETYKPGWIATIFVYLVLAAVLARSLAIEEMRPLLPRFLALGLVYVVLYTLLLWKSKLPTWLLHTYFVVQCILVLWMLSLRPQFDFVILLFLLLTFQVALNFTGWTRWFWVGMLILLSGGSLVYYLGVLEGLAKSLTTIAGEIILDIKESQ